MNVDVLLIVIQNVTNKTRNYPISIVMTALVIVITLLTDVPLRHQISMKKLALVVAMLNVLKRIPFFMLLVAHAIVQKN